ncbi:MAG: hypothetical protein F6J97_19980 [Leptolyngbya sp. SIO4C1]|nr:hypothetical protein [Leptolyngbya sp. SIO4C1]
MPYNPDKHHRQSIRLKGYDYSSAGAYFITLCTFQRQHLFGQITDSTMRLNEFGQIVAEEWMQSTIIRQEIDFDQWVIMPNHLHAIVLINPTNSGPTNSVGSHGPTNSVGSHGPTNSVGSHGPTNSVGSHGRATPQTGIAYRRPRSLSSFVAGFKSATTKRINTVRNSAGSSVWQRNYYDCIIRSQKSLQRIQQYIQNNPAAWQNDQLNPSNPPR